MDQPMPARAQFIAERVRNGDNYADIGRTLGLTKQRVQQIASQYGIKPLRPRRKPIAGVEHLVVELLESEPRISYKDVSERTGASEPRIKRVAKKAGIYWMRLPVYRRGLYPWDYDIDPETECWNWRYGTDIYGHGRLHSGAKGAEYAHRYAYQQYIGPIPQGESIIHTCGNLSCINPAHLKSAPFGRAVVQARQQSAGANPA